MKKNKLQDVFDKIKNKKMRTRFRNQVMLETGIQYTTFYNYLKKEELPVLFSEKLDTILKKNKMISL